MRSLLLQWCFLFLLTALSVAGSPLPDCNWKMPVEHPKCQQTIKYQVHDDKQALATCLEHFASTFIDAKRDESDTSKIICIVYRQYQCHSLLGAVSMFDKCYKFYPDLGEVTMDEYRNLKRHKYCKEGVAEGGIPVFFTMTQAKHIAMEAHRRGIAKIWVNVDANGKTIEKQRTKSGNGHEKGFMLYKDQWKLHKAHYWKGKELKATPMVDYEYTVPPHESADYMFFRSKNDHWNNLIQGSFERATIDSTAGIVCEYEPDNVYDQERFCGMMRKMGLNAIYNEDSYSKRCLYTTLTHYPMEGTAQAVRSKLLCQDFAWGNQNPREISSRLDDGTAGRLRPIGVPNVYETLTANGTYRISVTAWEKDHRDSFPVRKYCDMRPFSDKEMEVFRQGYQIWHSTGLTVAQIGMASSWENGYPLNECTDFPSDGTMESDALAIRRGKVIDVPVPVKIPLICAIRSETYCLQSYNRETTPLCDSARVNGKYCKSDDLWNPEIKRYGSCGCPKFHIEHKGICKWVGVNPTTHPTSPDSCGAIRNSLTQKWMNLNEGDKQLNWSNHIDKVVLRNRCYAYFMGEPYDSAPRGELSASLTWRLENGEFDIPNEDTTTQNGWHSDGAASSHSCSCEKPEETLCDGNCAQGPAYDEFVRKLAQE